MQEQTNGNDRRPGDMWTIEPCLYGRCNPSGAIRYVVVVRMGRQRVQITCGTFSEALEYRNVLWERKAKASRLRRKRIANGQHKEEVIYFIQAGEDGPIKIGRTDVRLVERRLANLQIAAHEELRLLGTLSGDSRTEHALHKRFAAARLRGEWFTPLPEIAALLDGPRPTWLAMGDTQRSLSADLKNKAPANREVPEC